MPAERGSKIHEQESGVDQDQTLACLHDMRFQCYWPIIIEAPKPTTLRY